MKIFTTTENHWLERWDAFVASTDAGSHLILSEWLKSFDSYGFKFEVTLACDGDEIRGGYGTVIARALNFRFYSVPFGPIAAKGYESVLSDLVAEAVSRAKFHSCCYCHVTLPVSSTENTHALLSLPDIPILQNAEKGHRFKYVYSAGGLNWVDIRNCKTEEDVLESFRTYVRRNVRSALRKGLETRYLESEADVRQGYDLCLLNASQNGYALRSWESFGATILTLIQSKKAKFIAAYKDGALKGCILLVRGGNYYTYILGGTVKEKPDLLVGHYLQWEAIRESLNAGFDGYNISLGGSKGIIDFKNGYATDQVFFDDGKYYWILQPVKFRVFMAIEKYLKPYKKTISDILRKFRK